MIIIRKEKDLELLIEKVDSDTLERITKEIELIEGTNSEIRILQSEEEVKEIEKGIVEEEYEVNDYITKTILSNNDDGIIYYQPKKF